jgi:hypothetical protein
MCLGFRPTQSLSCLDGVAVRAYSRPPDSTRRPSPLASRDDRGPRKAASQTSAIPSQFCSSGRDCRYPVHRERERSSLRRGSRGRYVDGKARPGLERTVRIQSQGESKSIVTVRHVGNMVGQCKRTGGQHGEFRDYDTCISPSELWPSGVCGR